MPYLNLKIAGSITKTQKAKLVEAFTQTISTVLNKPEQATLITIEEFPRENWGRGGQLLE